MTEFPMNVTPACWRYCRDLMARKRLGRDPLRVVLDDSHQGLTLQFWTKYDDERDVMLEHAGVRLVVERELGEHLQGWKLDAIASLQVPDSFHPRPPGPETTASNPGRLTMDRDLVKFVQPELAGWQGWLARRRDRHSHTSRWEGSFDWIADQIRNGDTRAAIVLTVSPRLLIAAYSDDLDCVAALAFPSRVTQRLGLDVGSRLVTCNYYQPLGVDGVASDLAPGPSGNGLYANFRPIIANFVSADQARLNELAAAITSEEWERTAQLGQAWLERFQQGQVQPRLGSPLWALAPADKPPWTNAGMWERAIAAIIDIVLVTLLVATVWWFFFGFDAVLKDYFLQPKAPGRREKFLAMRDDVRDTAALSYLVYATVMLASSWQTTLGKRLLCLKVISTRGRPRVGILQAVYRTALMLLGSVFSLLKIAKSKSHQAWHDKRSQTQVVRIIQT